MTFEVRRGDELTLQVEQHTVQGIGPHVEVYDPGGDLFEMGESYDYSGQGIAKPVRFEITVNRDGTYTVLISSSAPEGKGGYQISLTQKRHWALFDELLWQNTEAAMKDSLS